jgi:hypothetical protein
MTEASGVEVLSPNPVVKELLVGYNGLVSYCKAKHNNI